MKRIIFLIFLVTGLQLEANALKVKNDKITYEVDLSAHTAEVTGVDQDFSGTLTIPNPLTLGNDTYFVVGIADNACKNCSRIMSATLPETVTYMGKSAFQDCRNLKSVNIPKNVKRIEYATFMGCQSLSSIVIPEGVEYIGVYAFQGCLALESINFPTSVNEIATSAVSNTALTAVNIPGNGNTTIGKEAFRLCQNLKIVEIGDGVVSIGEDAFWHCWKMESVVIGNKVKTIGAEAFVYCDMLQSVTLGEGLETIGKNAFSDCNNLKEVHVPSMKAWCNITIEGVEATDLYIQNLGGNPLSIAHHLFIDGQEVKDHLIIPDGVTKLADGLFWNFQEITNVSIPASVKEIGHYAFGKCGNLTKVTLQEGTETIGIHAFLECSQLKEIDIPNSVNTLSQGAFSYCANMTKAKVGNGVTTLEAELFCNCSSLASVTLPKSIKTIGPLAFAGCKLTQINIPELVTQVGINAFLGCTSLNDIFVFSSTPAEIFEYTFEKKTYSKATLHVPAGSLQNYVAAAYWKKFTHMVDDILTSEVQSPMSGEEPQIIFDLNGKRLSHLTPGINIIKYKNGEIRKRFVRKM